MELLSSYPRRLVYSSGAQYNKVIADSRGGIYQNIDRPTDMKHLSLEQINNALKAGEITSWK
jgi:hypothetical protein